MDLGIVATIVGAVFGSSALSTLVSSLFSKNKTEADAASVLVQSMLEWQKTLTERISSLERMITDKDKMIEELKERIIHLEMQVFHHQGIEPHTPKEN